MLSAGRILILPQGTWDNATMYNMLDLVAYNGISWLCKRQCVGITPSVTATEYWQQFGSSAPIASTTVAGLVMPDGQTITINTTTGAIAVPTATAAALGLVKVDGTSITIDANGVISSAGGNLSNLGDVAITSLTNGQVLIWNQTNQKWQNGTIAGALSQLSDVTISSESDGQILVYDSASSKWKNASAQATLSSSTKPIQTKVVKDMASDVIETLSAGASQAYSAGDLIMCSNGKWYKAITDISQNQTLTAGGNIEETSQREVNTNLTQSLGGVEFKIDSVNNKGQYSIDGGSTWQNFSGASSLIAFGDATTTYTFEDNYSSIMVVAFCTSANPQSTHNMHWIYPNVTSNDITLESTVIKAPSFITAEGSYVNNSVTLYEGANVNLGDQINLAYASTGNPQTKSFVYAIFGG